MEVERGPFQEDYPLGRALYALPCQFGYGCVLFVGNDVTAYMVVANNLHPGHETDSINVQDSQAVFSGWT